jgi:TPR repeat protein
MKRQMKPVLSFLSVALLTLSCSKLSPEQEHFDKAYQAYNDGHFTSAVLYLKPLVEAGNPAAQLLMAKMYANGSGLPEDPEKADLLRNLAAFQIFKKNNLAPGELQPGTDTLAAISKRLDYYVGAGEGKKEPIQNLNQVLDSINIHGIQDLQKLSEEETPSAAAAPEAAPASEPFPAVSIPADSRASSQISLGIIRQAADSGDPAAMDLLSAAYSHGFYGLASNASQAAAWTEKAANARHRGLPAAREPSPTVPVVQVSMIIGGGLVLIGAGVWFWVRNRSR